MRFLTGFAYAGQVALEVSPNIALPAPSAALLIAGGLAWLRSRR